MKYGREMTQEICKHLAMGVGRNDSCQIAGISYETFTVWMEKHPEFADAVKTAEAKTKERCLAIIQKHAIKSWQAAAWLLERKWPQEFAQRVAHQNPDGSPMNLHSAAILLINTTGGPDQSRAIQQTDKGVKRLGSPEPSQGHDRE